MTLVSLFTVIATLLQPAALTPTVNDLTDDQLAAVGGYFSVSLYASGYEMRSCSRPVLIEAERLPGRRPGWSDVRVEISGWGQMNGRYDVQPDTSMFRLVGVSEDQPTFELDRIESDYLVLEGRDLSEGDSYLLSRCAPAQGEERQPTQTETRR